ncbi:MAG: hypothetical protein ACI8RD_007978 [Bacillariaceae sp.]|jgi:hypothetical protein
MIYTHRAPSRGIPTLSRCAFQKYCYGGSGLNKSIAIDSIHNSWIIGLIKSYISFHNLILYCTFVFGKQTIETNTIPNVS